MFGIVLAATLAVAHNPWITVGTDGGASWFRRDGHPFWSFGVDCVEPGVDPTKISKTNPAYSGLQLFPTKQTWTRSVSQQLRSWGFNSLGAWSDAEAFRKWGGGDRLPNAACLHLGAYDKAPWHDLFGPSMRKAIDAAAAAQIPPLRDDPYLIGYFSDNELGWWDDTLFLSYLHMPPSAPGHAALIAVLQSAYHHRLSELKRDWKTSADSIDSIRDLKLRPGTQGRRVVKLWVKTLAQQYYRLVHDAIRRYDPHHLILGDRYCQYYTLPVVEASSPYVDVVSTNLGADWIDGSISPFFLDTLHEATGKPVLVTEFYMAAKQNRSGDKNSSDGFPVVETQRERADAFSRYVRQVASERFTVGAHWFQYYDEPGNGRGDGENYNMGLVDVKGRPYEEITASAASLQPDRIHERARQMPAPTIPNASGDPFQGLKSWDRSAGPLKPSSPLPTADLYICRAPNGLYLGLYSMDYADKSLYADAKVSEADRCRFQLRCGPRGRAISVRFGDDRPPSMTAPKGCRVKESGGLKSTLILFIPAALFGGSSLPKAPRFEAVYTSHGRAETVTWRDGSANWAEIPDSPVADGCLCRRCNSRAHSGMAEGFFAIRRYDDGTSIRRLQASHRTVNAMGAQQ